MAKQVFILIVSALILATSSIGAELKFNTQDFPPFNYMENGKVSGPVADIIRVVCKEMGIQCSFKLMVWKNAQQEVREGKANGMFVIGWNRGRSEWLYFTPQILETQYGFFVAKGNPLKYGGNIKDLSEYRVGVFGPSNTATSLKKIQARMDKDKTITPLQIDMRDDDVTIFKDLNSTARSIVAIYSNRDVGYSIIRKENLNRVRYAGAQRSLFYFIGFSKKYTDKALVNSFNKTYVQLYQKGDIANLLQIHNMVPAQIEPHIIAYFSNQ